MRYARGRGVAAALALACALTLLLPGPGGRIVAALVALLVAVAATRGLARLPRGGRAAWSLVVVGLVLGAGARVAEAAWRPISSGAPEVAPTLLVDPLAALLVAAGLATVVGPPRVRDLASMIDALVIAAAVGTSVGVLVIQPAWSPAGAVGPGPLLLVAHPAAHLVLLVAAVGLAMMAPWRLVAGRLLAAGALGLAAAGALMIALTVRDTATTAAVPVALVAHALVALAVRHDSARELARLPSPQRATDAPWRIAVLAAALLLLPLTAAGIARDGADLAVAVATAVVVLLLTGRLALLLRDLRRSRARELREEQRRGHRRLEALVRHASDALLVLGGDRITYATPAARAVFGSDPTGWTSTQLLAQVHPDDRDATHRALLETLVIEGQRPARLHTRLLDRSGSEHHVEIVAVDLTTDPDVGGTVLTLRDISERVALERRLRHLAFHDALTGLTNREVLQDRLVQALGRAARHEQPLAVLLCDLDDFKDVNDTHGHAVGDRLLVAVAHRLRATARSTDTVARLGGDEFAILCEDIHGHRDAIEIARRVLAATEEPVDVDGRLLHAGLSIGVAVDDGSRTDQDLLRDADIALYEAKADGKQRWAVHRRTMTERAQARLQLAHDLTAAVEAGRIEVAFQPIVRLPDLQITGVESLARWEHPEHGWVPPSDFIPLAEATGQIIALGDIVMRTALAAVGHWLRVEPTRDLRVGINVSARQVRDPRLPARVAGWLAEHDLDPSRLVLELTESVMLDEADDAIDVMQQLRELGIRFAVDDFGTGYSSLAYLRRLPVDIVKTDRAFVRELGRDEASTDLVRAVIEMARSLRLDVVAEGVETVEQRDALIAMGCGFAQGYLFSRPVAAEALEPRLDQPAGAPPGWTGTTPGTTPGGAPPGRSTRSAV